MTTTDQSTDAAHVDQIILIPGDRLAPHPDNVRASLGDVRELTRSLKAQGVIVPLLVLPADADGMHVIVAGHRRLAAGTAAGIEMFPAVIRDLTATQVLDAMLVENGQRADLTLVESIRAVARYQCLDPTDTATKIARRIGHGTPWVKSRLALALLPTSVLTMLDQGTLTVAQATALGPLIEQGDETVIDCAQHLTSVRTWRDADDEVARWVQHRRQQARYDAVVAKLDRLGVRRFETSTDAQAARAVALDDFGLGLDKAAAREHRHEPCHAVVVQQRLDTVAVTNYCTDPRRHRTSPTRPASSPITIEQSGSKSAAAVNETEQARRRARKQRHAAAVPMLAKGRFAKGAALECTARVWCNTVGQHAANKVCEFLGIDRSGESTEPVRHALTGWLDGGGDPTRLLLAIAGAELETLTRQADPLPGDSHAAASAIWLDLLVRHGGYSTDGHDLP